MHRLSPPLWPALAALLLTLRAPCGAAPSLAPSVDGDFIEWESVAPLLVDAAGDVPSSAIDLGAIALLNDAEALYMRLELGRETILQNPGNQPAGNDLQLLLDMDNDPATGLAISGIGVDLRIAWGNRSASYYPPGGGSIALSLNEAGTEVAPTHSGDVFELRMPFAIRPGLDAPLDLRRGAGAVSLVVVEQGDGDRLPDSGALTFPLATEFAPPPEPIPLQRVAATDIRLLCNNVEFDSIVENPEPFRRFLATLRPDIVNYQEVWDTSADTARAFVEQALPLPEGEQWHAAKVDDNITVSRFPILHQADVAGNLLVLIDLPDERSAVDLVLFNAHTPCCGNNEGRDREHDAISATWRNLLAGNGPFTIAPDDAVVMLGDFNMVGFVRQLETLRDGRIIDEASWGPSFAPGRAAGSLRVAPLRHLTTRFAYTWRHDQSSFAPGRLDWILYAADAATLRRNFAVWTPDLTAEELAAAGWQRDDSLATDHLTLIADFAFAPPAPAADGTIAY